MAIRWAVRLDHEQGSVSILALCASLALFSVTCTLAMVGQLLLMHRTVETAADLAALAGAQHLIDGGGAACANSRLVASLNHTELINCTSEMASVLVVVGQQVQSPAIRRLVPLVTATSKAGY